MVVYYGEPSTRDQRKMYEEFLERAAKQHPTLPLSVERVERVKRTAKAKAGRKIWMIKKNKCT